MLKLKRVQILGFKSFCDRTDVQLTGAGVAAVVGPNGCGKSNISDAITWVLGEQSAKSLRGTKMDDVIFAGTRDRKPTGMAEVSLTLIDPDVYDPADGGEAINIASSGRRAVELHDWDEAAERKERAEATADATAMAQPGPMLADDDGELGSDPPTDEHPQPSGDNPVVLKVRRRKFNRAPVRAGEVTVTRRLFRSGDSEYLLNGKLCRLRDIQDIFFGTGLTGENYAIIGQERIGQLLSSKPLDRRAIIEEAAGVTRFKTKKRLAELRLEASRQNLSRIDDIFDEVSKQMATLKRQVAKAERFAQLREELRTKLRTVLRTRLLQKTQEHRSAEAEGNELGATIAAQAMSLRALDAEHSTTVARGYALDEELRTLQVQANEARLEIERCTARNASNAARIADLLTRSAATQDEITQLTQQITTLATEREALAQYLSTAVSATEQARVTARARQGDAEKAQGKLSAADRETAQGRQQSLQLTHRISQLHREEAQASEALSNLRREAERLTAESEQARCELEELGRHRGQVSLSFESTTERLSRLNAEIAAARIALETDRGEEQTLRRRGDVLRGELASLKGKKQALDAQLRDHSYSTETVRKLLRVQKDSSSAPLGTLADFLEVDDDHGTVIDEFLREELNTLVVSNWQGARAGIALLNSSVEGRATFLVRSDSGADANGATDGNEDSIDIPGAIALLKHVRAHSDLGLVPPQLRHKLQATYLVPDAASAQDLISKHPEFYVLTNAGEIFHGATVSGGKTRSGGPLAVKRDAKATDAKLDEVQAQLSACDIAAASTTKRLGELQHTMEAHREERAKAEREAANSGAALRQMESEASRIERRLGEWSLQSERNRDAAAAKLLMVEQKKTDATKLLSEQEAIDLRVSDTIQSVEGLRVQREEAQAAAAAASAALAGLEERSKHAAANLSQNDRLHAVAEQRKKTLEANLVVSAGECARLQEENVSLTALLTDLSVKHQQLTLEGAARSAEVAALRSKAEELKRELASTRSEHELVRERRGTLHTAAARLSAEIEHLEAQSLQELNIPAAELQADTTVAIANPDELIAADADARSLRSKMEAIGPVNMMALEEFNEASQRHTFLQEQRNDLLESITNTQGAIREIDDVTKHQFNEAFNIINRNFSVTFTKLFGGGQALMKLTDEADLMESGIDLIASPPGKKLQNVLLLSGGEKALTALSLLVGIFQHQPSPFCILDEVDAPLDETNVGRFAGLIHEMSRDTQFIVITHHKRTMSEADLIYGVTMQEPGVSKIVSVNLNRNERRAVA